MTTSTVGKDFSSALLNLAPAQGGRNAADGGGFQKVWNNQMKQGGTGGTVQENTSNRQGRTDRQETVASTQEAPTEAPEKAEAVTAQPEKSSQEGETSAVKGEAAVETPGEELSPEELEAVMEVLGTAAMGLMEQIAQIFGISMEQLQETMDTLGLSQLDVLDEGKLGPLLLALGGAQDKSALIMDETLYGNYRTVMESLKGTLQECAGQLGVEPEELGQMIEEALPVKEPAEEPVLAVQESVPVEEAPEGSETVRDVPVTQEEDIVVTGESLKAPETEGLSDGQQTAEQQETGAGESRQSQEKHTEKPQQEGVYVQDFRPGEFSPQIQQPEGVYAGASSWDPNTRSIMNQIMDYMKLQFGSDTTSLEMQLHPASLGTLHIQLESKGGMVTANFITQNEAVKAALESQIVQLQESFEAQGVRIEAIEVTVQTHEFERNLEQGRGREQQEPQKKNRSRRINLIDPLATEGLDEEETLAAEVRAAGGSTVEYAV